MARASSRWRLWVLLLAWILPALGLLAYVWLAPPIRLSWDPLQPREIAVGYERARVLLEGGDAAQARDILLKLRQDDPFNPLIDALIGQTHRQEGHLEAAIASTLLALERDPRLGEAAYNLACDQLKLMRSEDALRALRQAVEAGLDVRSLAQNDPDLAPLKLDPRFSAYLSGAHHIPLHSRSAASGTQLEPIRVGDVLSFWVELLSLEDPPEQPAPSVVLSPRGGGALPALAPVRRILKVERGITARGTGTRWVLELELRVLSSGLVQLGPWEASIGGVSVALPAQVLDLQDAEAAAAGTSGVHVSVPVPLARALLSWQMLEGAQQDGVTVRWHPPGAIWSQQAGLTVDSVLPPEGASLEAPIQVEVSLTTQGSYDEMGVAEGRPQWLRRTFALTSVEQVQPGTTLGVRLNGRPIHTRVSP